MLKAYLEPNAINWGRRSAWSGAELRRRLEALDFEPHFGIHGIYELARGLLSPEHETDARRNFEILSDLEPVFGPTPELLFSKELDWLRTGATVIPTLDELNRASAKQQVVQMAAGNLEDEGREFLNRREADVKRDYPRFIANQFKQLQAAAASGMKKPTTFEDAFAEFNTQVPRLIGDILGSRVSPTEAAELHARLDEVPALRSAVRANLYLWAIPMVSGAGAAVDKPDDYRHVIEASYSHVFVTGDDQLARTVPRLHPSLRVLAWRELEAG